MMSRADWSAEPTRRTALRDLAGAASDGWRWGLKSYRHRRAAKPQHVSVGEIPKRILCFGGEFGYEILAWLPYLNHVAHELGVPLRTCSRVGSRPLYSFSAEHFEIEFSWRPDGYGSSESFASFTEHFGTAVLAPVAPPIGRITPLSLGGITWEHQRIHSRITTKNYRPLAVPLVARPANFLPSTLPVAVINNKDFENWGNRDPLLRESFSREQLVHLRDELQKQGYFVVYHRFDEPVPEDRFPLDDDDLFEGERALDMRHVYARAANPNAVTELQLQLYASARFAVCPQGGNSFLPAMHGARTLVLSTSGRLVEYQDLSRLYGARVDVHTSFQTILEAVQHATPVHE